MPDSPDNQDFAVIGDVGVAVPDINEFVVAGDFGERGGRNVV